MEKWKIVITKSGEKDLKTLDQSIQKRIIQKINWLLENFQKINQERLSEKWEEAYKLRVGSWRVIYKIEYAKREILILKVWPRDRVYK